MSAFEPIKSVLNDVSKGSPLGLKLSQIHLQQEWEKLVGQTIAKHSYPQSIRYKKLYLVADNSIWLQQLVFLKSTILKAIHSLMPDMDITDIVLNLGSIPDNPPKPFTRPQIPSTPPVIPSPLALALTEQLSNPDLQASFAQTITKSLEQFQPPTLE